MAAHTWPTVFGTQPHIYKYAVLMLRNNYIDLSSFNNLKRRSFNVYQWISKPRNLAKAPDIVSGWQLWLQYKHRKWEKFNIERVDYTFDGPCMMPAHIFFKTGEELKEWLGSKNVSKMFAELL